MIKIFSNTILKAYKNIGNKQDIKKIITKYNDCAVFKSVDNYLNQSANLKPGTVGIIHGQPKMFDINKITQMAPHYEMIIDCPQIRDELVTIITKGHEGWADDEPFFSHAKEVNPDFHYEGLLRLHNHPYGEKTPHYLPTFADLWCVKDLDGQRIPDGLYREAVITPKTIARYRLMRPERNWDSAQDNHVGLDEQDIQHVQLAALFSNKENLCFTGIERLENSIQEAHGLTDFILTETPFKLILNWEYYQYIIEVLPLNIINKSDQEQNILDFFRSNWGFNNDNPLEKEYLRLVDKFNENYKTQNREAISNIGKSLKLINSI